MNLKDLNKIDDYEKPIYFFNDDGIVLVVTIFSVKYVGTDISTVRILSHDGETIYEVPADRVYTDAEDHPEIIKRVISGIEKQIQVWVELRQHYIDLLNNEQNIFNKF